MDDIVFREYKGATIAINRETKKSLFVEGHLACLVPMFLLGHTNKVPDSILSQFNASDYSLIRQDSEAIRNAVIELSEVDSVTNAQDAKIAGSNALSDLAVYATRTWQLVNVNLELTYECNQRCVMCYIDDFRQKGISIDRLRLLAQELKEAGALFILFTGGEVFLRPDALDIMEEYEKMGFVLEIKTNGTILKPAIIDRLAKLHPFDIQISVYDIQTGYSEITRSFYRFDRIVDNVNQMRTSGLTVTLSVLVGKHNIDQIERIHEQLSRMDADIFYSPYITPNRFGRNGPILLRLSREEMELKLAPFFEKIRAFPERKKYRDCNGDSPVCFAGRDQIAIDPLGRVYPCLDLRVVLGNLNENSLNSILAKRAAVLKGFSFKAMEQCRHCQKKEFCDSCIRLALIENGDYRIPSSHKCDIIHFYNRDRNET